MRGGKRTGAGRKPKGSHALVSHAARPQFSRPMPVHVVMRVRRHVWSLCSKRSWRRIGPAFAAACDRFGMRLIEFSIQGNHIHLIVEADNQRALSRGMQGLSVRIAKAMNAMMQCKGRVFADHYFGNVLESPTKLVKAIRYVQGNHTHHFGDDGVDPYSSWALAEEDRATLLSRPRSWLLRVGWSRVDPDVYAAPSQRTAPVLRPAG